MGNLTEINEVKVHLQKQVKEKFLELIPEDVLSSFVDEAIEDFKQNDIKKVIIDELKIQTKDKIAAMLGNLTEWDMEKQQEGLNSEMKKLLVEHAPQMFQAMIQGAAAQMIDQLKMDIMNGNVRMNQY